MRILLIDDDRLVLNSTRRVLSKVGDVTTLSDPRQIEGLDMGSFDVVVCDFDMPQLNGRGVLLYFMNNYPGRINRFVFHSSSGEAKELAKEVGVRFIQKPAEPMVLQQIVSGVAVEDDNENGVEE